MDKVYVVELYDTGIYCAYKTEAKAKQALWECYCDEIDEDVRALYLAEDTETLEQRGYITDYGVVNEVTLVDE